MTVTLCVLLTPVGGKEADLVAYEDLVLPMLERHGGHMLHRVRRSDGSEGLKFGEDFAIRFLKEMKVTSSEFFAGFSLTKFDGTRITI